MAIVQTSAFRSLVTSVDLARIPRQIRHCKMPRTQDEVALLQREYITWRNLSLGRESEKETQSFVMWLSLSHAHSATTACETTPIRDTRSKGSQPYGKKYVRKSSFYLEFCSIYIAIMGIPLDIISESFHKLKHSISDEDAHNFASTEVEDVWKAVREIDSAQRQRQSAQNLRRVEPLLKGIEKYAKVIEVLCNGTPFMAYVWVSMSC
jgi:hypothetical protein